MVRATQWRGPGGDQRRRALVLTLGAAVLGAASASCSPPAAPAGLRTEPRADLKQKQNERPAEQKREPAKSSGRRSLRTAQRYELPFTARANPFEPPAPQIEIRRTETKAKAVAPSDVRLVGLMSDDRGWMAALEVFGEQRLARPGEQVSSKNGVTGVYIREIRTSDVVVEQQGRRWVLSLPRPGGNPEAGSVPQVND